VSEDRRRIYGSEVQIFTVSLNGANICIYADPQSNVMKAVFIQRMTSRSKGRSLGCVEGNKLNMSHIKKLTPKLRKAPQPPLSYAGATADADRAKRPALVQPRVLDSEVSPGDRVEGLANFGKPTGEFGTVEQTNEDDALVKWDDDGRTRLGQPWLKKLGKKVYPLGKPASA
jgi:hypothetical protein